MTSADHSKKKAVVLLSGGLDSATALAQVLADGYDAFGLNIHYGQRNSNEIAAARKIAAHFKVPLHELVLCHPVITTVQTMPHAPRESTVYAPGVTWGGSSLLMDGEVPINPDHPVGFIPSTYVPARNTFLLGLAASLAEAVGASVILAGLTPGNVPDASPAFVEAMEEVLYIGTRAGVHDDPIRIVAPFATKKKTWIIKRALALNVPIHLTWTCYQNGRVPCGACDACIPRIDGFTDLGLKDPAMSPSWQHVIKKLKRLRYPSKGKRTTKVRTPTGRKPRQARPAHTR